MKLQKDMNKDLQEFPVYKIYGNRLVPAPEITSTECYNHLFCHAHHFIKDTHYKKNRKWYDDRGIEQKLILMTTQMHGHLESPIYGMSEAEFLRVYKIPKHELIFSKKKWARG